MVGLVIVSHSAKLAEGVAELMRGMVGTDVPIAAVGGTDAPEHPLGTNANLIHKAIVQVWSADGVVVLVDLGSAILSTEFAIGMLPAEQSARVVIAPAPLVEGGFAAAVQAHLGKPLEQVVAEARNALDAKLAQMGQGAPTRRPPDAASDVNQLTPEFTFLVKNRLGLHARPATRFVQTAARFHADVRVRDLTNGQGPVDAKSINAVTTLGVLFGHQIQVTAEGADAQAALDALFALASEKFGETELAFADEMSPGGAGLTDTIVEGARTPSSENEIIGYGASDGYAIGAARLFRPTLPPVPQHETDDPQLEWRRLIGAIQQAQEQLSQVRRGLNERGGTAQAEIFDAQVLMLSDNAIQEPARRSIFESKENAAAAFQNAAEQVATRYDALDDEFLRARATDVRAVAQQVLMNLLGATQRITLAEGILVARDLTPAETAQLDPKSVQAICTALGTPTAHSAILAKGLGIPTVVGLGERILQVAEGETLIVDGARGSVLCSPDAQQLTLYRERIEGERRAAETQRAERAKPAITRDGRRVEIAANIGSVREAERAVEMGAEAVGLFRTEFLFLGRRDAPDEEEQYQTYRGVAQALQNRVLLIRTLDVGGDKPLPYVNLRYESNPFLGLRGLRLSLALPDLFKTQLRAILRAAYEFPIRVMFPMVSVLQEFHEAQAWMVQARTELQARGVPVPERIETGIMVEVPSAALTAAAFARDVDFFSIGTNDLTQYTLAAERGNVHVARLAEPLHPAVLELVARVVSAAHAQHKWVGVCGEMGNDAEAIPILIGLGVDELSMPAAFIPRAKQIVRELHFADSQTQARARLPF